MEQVVVKAFVPRASTLLLCELRSLHSVSVGAKPLSTGQCAPRRRLFLSQDAISCERKKKNQWGSHWFFEGSINN